MSTEKKPLLDGVASGFQQYQSQQSHHDAWGPSAHINANLLSTFRRARNDQIESFQYRPSDSAVYEAGEALRSKWFFRSRTFFRWVLTVVIAITVGATAVFVTYCTRWLFHWKFMALTALIEKEREGSAAFGSALAGWLAICLSLVIISASMTAWIEPGASGSGICEIKSILNGAILPRMLRFKTMVVKVVGLIFSVASGLPVGREGPFIHIGGGIAAGVTQGKSTTLGFNTRFPIFKPFRNDDEKRGFVTSGAAAGVAAAFGAVAGGVLFVVEEGASHWERKLVWRTFFCAIITAWTLQLFLSGFQGTWGAMGVNGLFTFGQFGSSDQNTWQAFEMPFFIALGALGGVAGALMVALQRKLIRFRARYLPITKPWLKLAEASLILCVLVVSTFLLSYFAGGCTALPPPTPGSNSTVADGGSTSPGAPPALPSPQQQFFCPDGEYNELASLFLLPAEESIRFLFHSTSAFSIKNLTIFSIFYFFAMTVVHGISVPAGIFIPALLSGAGVGRLAGELLAQNLPAAAGDGAAGSTAAVSAGVYALIGAAAFLGGVTRMTISLAVILLECSGSVAYALPLISTLMTARFVGNFFGDGLYDAIISARNWPLLEDHTSKELLRGILACDLMAKPPLVVREVETVSVALAALTLTQHNAFPVVYSESTMQAHPRLGSLAGIITRRELSVLLALKAFHPDLPTLPFDVVQPNPTSSSLSAFAINLSGVHLAPLQQGKGNSGGNNTNGLGAASSYTSFSNLLSSGGGAGGGGGGGGSGISLPTRSRSGTMTRSAEDAADADSLALTAALLPGGNGGASGKKAGRQQQQGRRNNNNSGTNADAVLSASLTRQSALAGGVKLRMPAVADSSYSGATPRGGGAGGSFIGGGGGHLLMAAAAAAGADTDDDMPSVPPPPGIANGPRSARRERPPPPAGDDHNNNINDNATVTTTGDRDRLAGSGIGIAVVVPALSPSMGARRLRRPSTVRITSEGSNDNLVFNDRETDADGLSLALALTDKPVKNTASSSSHSGPASGAGTAQSSPYHAPTSKSSLNRNASAALPSLSLEPAVLSALGGGSSGAGDNAAGAATEAEDEEDIRGHLLAVSATPAAARFLPDGGSGLLNAGENYRITVSSSDATAAGSSGAFALGGDGSKGTGAATGAGASLTFEAQPDILQLVYSSEPLLSSADFDAFYPRYPDASTLVLTQEEKRMFLDLRPYLNPTPFTIHVHAPAERVLEMFKNLGLRHLVVVNDCHDVVGIITRKDLLHRSIVARREEKIKRSERATEVAVDTALF